MFTIYISRNMNAQYSSEYTRKVQSKWRSRKVKRLKLKFLFSRERKQFSTQVSTQEKVKEKGFYILKFEKKKFIYPEFSAS